MTSPARAHYEQTIAAQASASADASGKAPPMPEDGPVASEYQLMLAALGEDLRHLSEIQSVERKIEAKRALIDRYRPWLAGTLAATREDGEAAPQDDVVATMLVWAIDIADWPLALALAGHVLTAGLALPERYKRTPATLIAEEVAEAGLLIPPQADAATLSAVLALTADHDMPDQVRAKLHKALGRSFQHRADAFDPTADSAVAGGKAALLAAALDHFHRALALDSGSGVKKVIETLERMAAKLAAPTE